MGTKTTDDDLLAKVETGTLGISDFSQSEWEELLEVTGFKAKVNSINREVNRLLKEKKEITTKVVDAANAEARYHRGRLTGGG